MISCLIIIFHPKDLPAENKLKKPIVFIGFCIFVKDYQGLLSNMPACLLRKFKQVFLTLLFHTYWFYYFIMKTLNCAIL
jgi:hypothetical protein